MIKGYCAVTGDILHAGHIQYIKKCKSMCDFLIVGVMTDKCVKRYKGKYPIMPYNERALIVSELRDVDWVIEQDTFEFDLDLRRKYNIGVVFDGTEHKRKGANIYIPYHAGISSSLIKERIIDTYSRQRKA